MRVDGWKKMVAFLSVMGSVFVSTPALSQAHQTQPVLVVNGSGAPVPVVPQGTTNVSGTVNLTAGSTVSIGNTPSVNVANNASVTVSNTPTVTLAPGAGVMVANPLDAQNNPAPLATLEALQPYEDFCTVVMSGVSGGLCSFQPLPARKRLVVEEFDGLGLIDPGLKPLYIGFCPATGCLTTIHYLPAVLMGRINDQLNPVDFYVTSQPTRFYVGANQTPGCVVNLSDTPQASSYTCQIFGFLVDVPQ